MNMSILVTNDDGIHAPGLAAAEAIARQLSDDVWVVAPLDEQSGASRSLSLSVPIRMQEAGEKRHAVRGTPVDCVIMAIRHLMPEKPALVISGVNRGQNIADDITYSGTIAAAIEGAAFDVPSFALSQCYGIESTETVPFEVAQAHGAATIRAALEAGKGAGRLFNVNFPDCAADAVRGIAVTRQGKRDVNELIVEQRTDLRHRPYYWLGFRREANHPPRGTDLFAVQNRLISLTPLSLNLTDEAAMKVLQERLGNGLM